MPSMNREQLKALVAIPLVVAIGVGFAWAGSSGAAFNGTISAFATSVAVAFLFQWIAFVPSFLKRTEAYFDLVGSVTYIVATAMALFSSKSDARSVLLATMVFVWAGRLGYFLFQRIQKAGKDGRFDDIKNCFVRFLAAWTLQGLWITFTAAAAWAAITSDYKVSLGGFALLGSLVWLIGFVIEVVADAQKSQFKANPANEGKFIQTGLWSRSRHPNYFGEIVLWTGVAIIAIPVLQGWQWLVLSSPFLVALLLIYVSGIPLLEKRADEKWAGQDGYEAYKKNTPVLIPRLW